ncbi:pilus assembly protein PilP [Pseudoalteromonas umbrosa]|uniref:pilus assembly protein PilP n=1 Tax=Pseudoalteromonas umbrosa TaxID=3048489 RepID=UPI0024C236B8|nr:pilus assembly protein PilP [Pseudoalteromonas sp. B95]MDK1289104.1 pilus assembly protein PilP [Pseudoalteromonas sp. B95]
MMRLAPLVLLILLLSGCNDDTAEQKEYIDRVQASATPYIDPIPEMMNFEHFPYQASELRSPFVAPQPEVIENRLVQIKNCLHPDPERMRDPLEKFPLDNLVMKGIIATNITTWALIKAADQGLYRVKEGQYMGLYHGEVVGVHSDRIELMELIPDGSGCWKERLTTVEMPEAGEMGASE